MDPTAPLDDPLVQALVRHLGSPTSAGGGELRFNSPFQEQFRNPNRPDSKKHLYVNVRKGQFFDFKTNLCGSVSYLFRLLGEDYKEERVVPSPYEEMLERVSSPRHTVPSKEVADLPEWYSPVVNGSKVYNYLLGRGITEDDVLFYKIGEGTGQYRDWVVIPSFGSSGTCEYWVARSTGWKSYLNPKAERKFHVGFLHQASQGRDHVVLCEGVFSAIVAGRDAVAAYGKYVTNHQLSAIQRSGVNSVYIALDGDARRESLDVASRCWGMGLSSRVVFLPDDQDPADLGRDTFRYMVERCSVEVDPYSILRMKLEMR